MEEENKKYLAENIGVTTKILKSFTALREIKKLFNSLCGSCKEKVLQNPRMKIEEYCPNCQAKARQRMGKLVEAIK